MEMIEKLNEKLENFDDFFLNNASNNIVGQYFYNAEKKSFSFFVRNSYLNSFRDETYKVDVIPIGNKVEKENGLIKKIDFLTGEDFKDLDAKISLDESSNKYKLNIKKNSLGFRDYAGMLLEIYKHCHRNNLMDKEYGHPFLEEVFDFSYKIYKNS